MIDGETLGGAVTHTEISGVAHYAADDDEHELVLRFLSALPLRVRPKLVSNGALRGSSISRSSMRSSFRSITESPTFCDAINYAKLKCRD